MNTFVINGKNFKLSKIDAFKQFHIVRRIAPILSELMPVLGGIKKVGESSEMSEAEKFEEIAKIMQPIMLGLSKLSDEDSNKVLFGLLNSVEIQQDSGIWARIANDSMLMIQNLELPVLLQIAGKAFVFNLSGFFTALPHQK
jgi:hypothetical protein